MDDRARREYLIWDLGLQIWDGEGNAAVSYCLKGTCDSDADRMLAAWNLKS